MMFANDVSGRNFSFVEGVSGSHYELSHHENNQARIAQYARINRWHVEQFAGLMKKLKSIPEVDSTQRLLDPVGEVVEGHALKVSRNVEFRLSVDSITGRSCRSWRHDQSALQSP